MLSNEIKVLIIGGTGFVGGYLIEHLRKNTNWNITITKSKYEVFNVDNVNSVGLDILEFGEVVDLLKSLRPDYIFHLAAQSSIALSWENPSLTIDVNIKGTLNILDAIRSVKINPRILLIGSGEEYGFVQKNEVPIKESNHVRPGNIYAVTKAAQNSIGQIYSRAYSLNILMVRAFNHIGPRQSPLFVVSDFCKQVAEIEKGLKEPKIYVGNLSAYRDFTDVRDVVSAYTEIIMNGSIGETYNVGQGKSIAIEEVLTKILSLSKSRIEVIIDQNKLRPVDVPLIEADISKIQEEISWSPKISLEQTLSETLEYWRLIV